MLATSSDLVDNHFHYHLIGKQLWQKEATRYGWQQTYCIKRENAQFAKGYISFWSIQDKSAVNRFFIKIQNLIWYNNCVFLIQSSKQFWPYILKRKIDIILWMWNNGKLLDFNLFLNSWNTTNKMRRTKKTRYKLYVTKLS